MEEREEGTWKAREREKLRRMDDPFSQHLLQECQSAEATHRVNAQDDLCKPEYLDLLKKREHVEA